MREGERDLVLADGDVAKVGVRRRESLGRVEAVTGVSAQHQTCPQITIEPVRYLVIAVGRLRPPYVDDAEHYLKRLRAHARIEMIEVKTDDQVSAISPTTRTW